MQDSHDLHPIASFRCALGVTLPQAPSANAESLHAVLGQRLRRLRIERGLTCHAVAVQLGVPPKRIEAQERGKRRLEPHELVAYAMLYGVRVSSFFRDH